MQAHNCFTLPVLSYTCGTLNWSKKDISQLDVRKQKLLTMVGRFHRNSDHGRPYSPRHKGGRDVKSVEDSFITRIALLSEYLKSQVSMNPQMYYIGLERSL